METEESAMIFLFGMIATLYFGALCWCGDGLGVKMPTRVLFGVLSFIGVISCFVALGILSHNIQTAPSPPLQRATDSENFYGGKFHRPD